MTSHDEILDQRYTLAFRSDYSARYHRRRASFLQVTDKLLSVTVLLAGTGAFISLMSSGPPAIAQFAAAIVALVSIIQIVFGIGQAGASHAEWMRRWDRLASDIRRNSTPTKAQLANWDETRAAIEGECVAELRALAVACENDARTYLGLTEGLREISSLQRLLIHFGTFQTDFPPMKHLPPALPTEET